LQSALSYLCPVTALAASFTDVPESHWSYAAIEKAATNGLVNGTGNSQYTPEKSVSNAEWCQMLVNLFPSDDMNISPNVAWWYNAVRYCHEMSWLENTTLRSKYLETAYLYSDADANRAISRFDMAQVIYNIATQEMMFTLTVDTIGINSKIGDYYKVPSEYRIAVEYCYAAGFITGVDQQGTFNGTGIMSRAQAATVLCRLLDAKNGTYVVPYFDKPAMNTAVKDMITIGSSTRPDGDYDITVSNTYTAGKLANGTAITEANITAMLNELEVMFPAGTSWGDSTNSGDLYYYSARSAPASGGGCNAWAGMTGDVIFGIGAKWTATTDFSNVKVGDLIQYRNANNVATHWVVVIGVTEEETMNLVNGVPTPGPVETLITICDGNNGAKVTWGNTSYIDMMLKNSPKSVFYSAY